MALNPNGVGTFWVKLMIVFQKLGLHNDGVTVAGGGDHGRTVIAVAVGPLADQLPDGTEEPETVEVDGRAPEDPPESESEVETTDTPEEETTDETDQ